MSQKKKIGIACYPTYGGSGVVATELGIALAEKGHEVHLMSYEQPIRLSSYYANLFFHQISVPDYPLFKYPPYCVALATQLADIADREGLDIIHVHYAIPHAISAYLAREMVKKRDVKTVVTLHGTDITIVGSDPSYERITRFGLEKADGITAVSEYLRRETVATFKTTQPIEVIPNFVDLRRFRDGDRRVPCIRRRDDELIVMHVSNFRPVKRVLDLVRAFAIVSKIAPATLVMVGDGPDRPPAEALARELGVADSVRFLGSQDAVERILPAADLFVLPSKFESFGLAALEAMACGIPVLASSAGGLPEVIEDGKTGMLCTVGDVDCLAAQMASLLRDPEKMRTLGAAAKKKTHEVYALERVLPQYEAFYDRLIAGENAAGATA